MTTSKPETKNKHVMLIHGKEYITVAGRVDMAHSSKRLLSVETEVIQHSPVVVVKATVRLRDEGVTTFTGISAANPAKSIEKQSPYEVAETSAVGRALGFAGFGSTDGIATAEEMQKALDADGVPMPTDEDMQGSTSVPDPDPTDSRTPNKDTVNGVDEHHCTLHNKALKSRGRGVWDHRAKGRVEGDAFVFDESGDWYWCQGRGWHISAKQ